MPQAVSAIDIIVADLPTIQTCEHLAAYAITCTSLGEVIQRGPAAQGALPQHDAVLQVRGAVSQPQAAKIDLHCAAINTIHPSGSTVRIYRLLLCSWPELYCLTMEACTPLTARIPKARMVVRAMAMYVL